MFRFTIRDVLWLTVVVAILAAWWADHSRLRAAYSALYRRAYPEFRWKWQ